MVDRSVTVSAALDTAEREKQLLYDKSVSRISDLYHHPDGFYAPEVIINLIKKHTGLEVERVHKKGLNNPEGKIYLIAGGKHYACVMRRRMDIRMR